MIHPVLHVHPTPTDIGFGGLVDFFGPFPVKVSHHPRDHMHMLYNFLACSQVWWWSLWFLKPTPGFHTEILSWYLPVCTAHLIYLDSHTFECKMVTFMVSTPSTFYIEWLLGAAGPGIGLSQYIASLVHCTYIASNHKLCSLLVISTYIHTYIHTAPSYWSNVSRIPLPEVSLVSTGWALTDQWESWPSRSDGGLPQQDLLMLVHVEQLY